MELSISPTSGPSTGGTKVVLTLTNEDSWNEGTTFQVVFCTPLRRIPVVAQFKRRTKSSASCECTSPMWGKRELTKIRLMVNKAEVGSCHFLFYHQPSVVAAKPDFVKASAANTITMLVLHLEQLNYEDAEISDAEKEIWRKMQLRVRLKTEEEETLETVKGQMFGEQLLADVGSLSVTGQVHFELSLNDADFDREYLNWKEEHSLLKTAANKKEAVKERLKDLRKKMGLASVTFWENPLLVNVEPDFLFFHMEPTVRVHCTGYPLFDTGDVVVNLSECDTKTGTVINNHTIKASAERGKEIVSFQIPNCELVNDVDLEVRVSLDGGKTMSPPCFKKIQVRGKPVVSSFSPLLASCEGGWSFTVRGENFHPRQGCSAWIRFQGRGYDRRVQILPSDLSSSEMKCVTPRLMELESYGNCRLKVKASFDDGMSWMDCGEEDFTSHPPLLPLRAKPRVISAQGGMKVKIEGENFFSSPLLMGRIVKLRVQDDGDAPGDQSQSFDFRLKYFSVQKCFHGEVPRLRFVGPAYLLVTLNGQDWVSVPEVLTVTDKEAPSEEGKAVERYEEMEKKRLVRMQERAQSLLQSSAPPRIARADLVKKEKTLIGGVGISVGKDAGGRMTVRKISRNSPAEGKLRVGDVIDHVRDVERKKEEEGEFALAFSSKNLKTEDVETLLRGPVGSWVIISLSSGRSWRLQRVEEEKGSILRVAKEEADASTRSGGREEEATAGRKEGRKEMEQRKGEKGGGKDAKGYKEEVISRSSLMRYRKHYERVQVKDGCLHRLRELHLPSSSTVTQWEVVAALLTSRRIITGGDLERFGIPRPSLLPYWSRSRGRRREAVRSEDKQEDGWMKEKRKVVKAELASGVHYEGEVEGSRAEGRGSMWFPDGTSYEGEFLDGQCHGEGRWVHKTGEVYVGSFRNGMAEGKGRLTGRGGEETFDGEFVQNLPHGWGRKTWGDGSSYEGEWRRGVQQGQGKWRKGGNEFEGRFEDGMPEGEGRMVYGTGEVYQGEWSKGIQHGRGVLFERKERIYDGLWRFGKRTGKGIDRRRMNNVGVYREEEREEGVEDLYEHVAERIEIRSMAEDTIGFVQAVGAEEEDMVHRYVISGVDVNARIPSSCFTGEPWLTEILCEEEEEEEEQEERWKGDNKTRELAITAMGVVCSLVRYRAMEENQRRRKEEEGEEEEEEEEEMYSEGDVKEERLNRMRDILVAGGAETLACLRRAVEYAEEEVVSFLLQGRYEDEWIPGLVDLCGKSARGGQETAGHQTSDRLLRVRALLSSCLHSFPNHVQGGKTTREKENQLVQEEEEEEQQQQQQKQKQEQEQEQESVRESFEGSSLLDIHDAMKAQRAPVVMPEGSCRLPDMSIDDMYGEPCDEDEEFDRSKHVSVKIDRVELEESQFDSLRRFPNLFVSAVFIAGDEEEVDEMRIYDKASASLPRAHEMIFSHSVKFSLDPQDDQSYFLPLASALSSSNSSSSGHPSLDVLLFGQADDDEELEDVELGVCRVSLQHVQDGQLFLASFVGEDEEVVGKVSLSLVSEQAMARARSLFPASLLNPRYSGDSGEEEDEDEDEEDEDEDEEDEEEEAMVEVRGKEQGKRIVKAVLEREGGRRRVEQQAKAAGPASKVAMKMRKEEERKRGRGEQVGGQVVEEQSSELFSAMDYYLDEARGV